MILIIITRTHEKTNSLKGHDFISTEGSVVANTIIPQENHNFFTHQENHNIELSQNELSLRQSSQNSVNIAVNDNDKQPYDHLSTQVLYYGTGTIYGIHNTTEDSFQYTTKVPLNVSHEMQ